MRPEKISMVEELRRKVSSSSFVILADYTGLNVAKLENLRSRLKAANAHLQVVQNRLFQRVARECQLPGFEQELKGPSAMVYGAGDVVAAAKVLKEFIKENEKPALKMGTLGKTFLTVADIERLASLPSREILLAQLVGLLAQPMRMLVGVFHQRLASLVYVLKAYEQKKKEQQT